MEGTWASVRNEAHSVGKHTAPCGRGRWTNQVAADDSGVVRIKLVAESCGMVLERKEATCPAPLVPLENFVLKAGGPCMRRNEEKTKRTRKPERKPGKQNVKEVGRKRRKGGPFCRGAVLLAQRNGSAEGAPRGEPMNGGGNPRPPVSRGVAQSLKGGVFSEHHVGVAAGGEQGNLVDHREIGGARRRPLIVGAVMSASQSQVFRRRDWDCNRPVTSKVKPYLSAPVCTRNARAGRRTRLDQEETSGRKPATMETENLLTRFSASASPFSFMFSNQFFL